MIKRAFITAVMLCATAIMLFAQNVNSGEKPRVYIEKFVVKSGVSGVYADKVRKAVMVALANTERFNLVDQEVEGAIKQEEVRRSDERAMSDYTARNEVMSVAANNYILTGNVNTCSVASQYKDGKTVYTCTLDYSVNITEAATSTTIASASFTHSPGTILVSTSESKEDAVTKSINLINSDIRDLIIKELPLVGVMVPIDYEVKKDKVVSCYVELGSDNGVKVNDYFVIMFPSYRAGRTVYTEKGKLKVTEVVDGTLSQCKVTSEGKEVYEALSDFLNLDEEIQKKSPIKVKSTIAPIMSGLIKF